MRASDINVMIFRVLKSIASDRLYAKKCFVMTNHETSILIQKGLHDEAALARILIDRINAHNSRVDAQLTRLENLNPRHTDDIPRVFKNKLIKPLLLKHKSGIKKLITENPTLDYYDIAQLYKRQI